VADEKRGLLFPDGLRGRRVLITGGLGFIGSNLAHRCLELGARVTIYDCLDPRSGGNLFNIEDICQDVELVMGDIRDFDCLSQHVAGHDLVFHCAAYTSHPNSMREPLTDVDVNCKGTLVLLEALRRFNPGARLVYLGTSTQVGRMYYRPIDELHVEFPVDIYSANKLAGEKYCLIYARAYELPVTVIRLANVFGPRSNIRSPDFGFINYFIGLGLQGKEIPVFGEGRQLRNITYVEDCVDALILAALSDRTVGEVFFAVSDNHYPVAEIAREIARIIGGRVKFVPWPQDRKAIEVGDAVISNRKFRSVVPWTPKHDLASGLVKTRDYYLTCLDKYI
jgi:UDP-glucose 4-epimerase